MLVKFLATVCNKPIPNKFKPEEKIDINTYSGQDRIYVNVTLDASKLEESISEGDQILITGEMTFNNNKLKGKTYYNVSARKVDIFARQLEF